MQLGNGLTASMQENAKCEGPSRISDDGCTVYQSAACTTDNSAFTADLVLSIANGDASHLTGIINLKSSGCSGTYDVDAYRQ